MDSDAVRALEKNSSARHIKREFVSAWCGKSPGVGAGDLAEPMLGLLAMPCEVKRGLADTRLAFSIRIPVLTCLLLEFDKNCGGNWGDWEALGELACCGIER